MFYSKLFAGEGMAGGDLLKVKDYFNIEGIDPNKFPNLYSLTEEEVEKITISVGYLNSRIKQYGFNVRSNHGNDEGLMVDQNNFFVLGLFKFIVSRSGKQPDKEKKLEVLDEYVRVFRGGKQAEIPAEIKTGKQGNLAKNDGNVPYGISLGFETHQKGAHYFLQIVESVLANENIPPKEYKDKIDEIRLRIESREDEKERTSAEIVLNSAIDFLNQEQEKVREAKKGILDEIKRRYIRGGEVG